MEMAAKPEEIAGGKARRQKEKQHG